MTPESNSRNAPRVVAQCGRCHDGSFARACAMIDAAADAGAFGVCFQKRSAPHWFADKTPRPPRGHNFGATEGEHNRALELTATQHEALRRHAHQRGLAFGLSVWDVESASEALHVIGADWIKLSRQLLVSPDGAGRRLLPLLAAVVPGKNLQCSCRDQTEARVVRAVAPDVRILYCPGRYPDIDSLVDAAVAVRELDAAGISLHTRVLTHAWDAITSGVQWVEYHLALPNTLHEHSAFALEPDVLRQLCLYLANETTPRPPQGDNQPEAM